jgi:hypothetical protein
MPKRYLRWYVWVIGGFCLLLLLLPTLFSTTPGKNLLLTIVRSTTGQDLNIDKLSLSWLGPQEARGVTFKDEKRHIAFECTYAQTEAPIWKISNFDVSLNIHEGTLHITPLGAPPIIFQEIDILLTAARQDLPLIFSITGKTEEQGVIGNFAIKGQIAQFHTDHPEGNIEATVSHLPLLGVDQLLGLKGALVACIGSTIDLNLTAHGAKEALSFNMKASSPNFRAHIEAISQNNSLELSAPAQITLKVTPTLVSRFSLPSLKQETLLTADLSSLSCPFSEKGIELKKLKVDAAIHCAPAYFSDLTISALQVQLFSQSIDEKVDAVVNVSSPDFTLSTATLSLTKEITLTAPLSLTYTPKKGTPFTLNVATFSLPPSFALEKMQTDAQLLLPSYDLTAHLIANTWDNIAISLQGKNYQTDLTAKIVDEVFIIKKPFTISASLTSTFIKTYFPNIALREPAPIKIDVAPLSLPFKTFDLTQIQGQGKAYANELLLTSKEGSKQFLLKNPEVRFSFNGSKETAGFQMTSTIEEGTLSLDVTLTQFSFSNSANAIINATGALQNISPSFFDILMVKNLSLQTLLGNTLDLSFKLNSQAEKQTFSLNAKSPNLYFSGNFLLQNNLLQLESQGLAFNFIITKESYPLFDNGPLKLAAPAVCSLQIEEMQWPVVRAKKAHPLLERIPINAFNWDLMRLKGELLLKELKYQQFTLMNTTLQFEKRENILFNLNSSLSPQGQIAITGEMPGTPTPQMKVHALIKDFPTIALDLLPRLFGSQDLSFVPVFGKTLNAQVDLDLNDFNGPIGLNLTSENTRISLKGEMQHGFLTLKESLHAQVLMTPELSALILKQLNPLSIKEITSKSPITLEIDSTGFLLPIHPFTPSKLFMKKGVLEFGKISCHNEGNISTTLNLLKWGKIGKGDTLKLWLAPCVFSIQQGVATLERTEILLADAFDIAIWGNVDLVQHYINTTLGLTSSALSSAFGIKNLPKDYVLQIPMKGPMNNVTIDTAGATTKIALLLAWQQKDLAGAFGSKGAFFNGLIDKVVPLPDMNTKAPPAKHPFPWEIPEKQKTSGTPIKKGDKPLKQLLKVIK